MILHTSELGLRCTAVNLNAVSLFFRGRTIWDDLRGSTYYAATAYTDDQRLFHATVYDQVSLSYYCNRMILRSWVVQGLRRALGKALLVTCESGLPLLVCSLARHCMPQHSCKIEREASTALANGIGLCPSSIDQFWTYPPCSLIPATLTYRMILLLHKLYAQGYQSSF